MSLALLWVQLAVAAALILVAAVFMTKSADVIAFKTGMGRAFAGVLLLATLATGWIAWVARYVWRDRERTLRWSVASGGCALAMMLLVALEKV